MSHFQTRIPILTVTSKNYTELFDIFKESLQLETNKQLQLHVLNLNMDSYTTFGFQTDSWYHATTEKIRFTAHFMRDNPDHGVLIFSDADISFMQPSCVLSVLVRDFIDKDLDYYGMRENTELSYNTGFYIVRNNERVRTFFMNVLESIDGKRLHLQDQTAVNNLIFCSNLKHEFIPLRYTVWGPSDHVRPDSIFHHAVVAFDTTSKIEQIIRKQIEYKNLTSNI